MWLILCLPNLLFSREMHAKRLHNSPYTSSGVGVYGDSLSLILRVSESIEDASEQAVAAFLHYTAGFEEGVTWDE